MKDLYGREITYLRISVTDLCNYRCLYCMPSEGVKKLKHEAILSLEEILEIAEAAASLGISKIRLTGGEPLVRRGISSLCRSLAALPGVTDLSMTTNGALLPPLARELREAGLGRLNLSLDTLDPDKFRLLTRRGELAECLAGLQAALEAGFSPIKLNTVLMGGLNDDEIPALAELTRRYPVDLRFIELMPIGHTVPFGPEAYLPVSAVLERLPQLQPEGREGVARLYRLPGAQGRVGLISPLSNHFCGSCNRLRLTADGFLKPCLHSAEEIPLRGLHGGALRAAIRAAIQAKPPCHGALSSRERSRSARDMNQIGG